MFLRRVFALPRRATTRQVPRRSGTFRPSPTVLASAPPPPRIRSIRASRTAYDTEVEFEVPAAAASFEFVQRLTTSPDWEGVIAAANVEATVETKVAATANGRRRALLKGAVLDDLVIGLRSIGGDGARSRAATPPDPDRMQRGRAR